MPGISMRATTFTSRSPASGEFLTLAASEGIRLQQNPYAKYANPYTVYGSPRTPSPQTDAQAQKDTLDVTKSQLDIANNPLDRESKRTSIEQNRASMENQQFNRNQGLRQEYNALPEVKNYSVALQSLGTALKAPDTPQGDLATIYAYAKAADPGSVVREGEMDMATATASLPEKWRADALRLTQGKRLPPEVRLGLVETMRQAVAGLRQVYDQQRSRYEGLAQQNGFDPQSIIGPPLYEAYRPSEEAYIRAHGGTPRSPGAPVAVAPAQTGAGFDKSPDPKAANLSPAQSAAYDAWWNAHPDPTPDQLRAFGTSMGINIGNADQIIAARKQTGTISHDLQYTPDISDARDGNGIGEKVDAAVRGAADTLTFGLADKAAALGDTITGNDTFGQNLARQYAISDFDAQNHAPSRIAGQLGGAVALPMGEMTSIPQIAAKGGALGAAYGAGSSRTPGDIIPNAAMGGIGGASIGAALPAIGKGAQALAVRGARAIAGKTTPEQQALLRAGEQENVPLNMGDVYPNLRNTIATQETIPLSAGPIRQGIQNGRDAIEGRVASLSRGGTPRENMGEAAQEAGRNFVAKSNKQAGRLYNVARNEAGNVKIEPALTKDVLTSLAVREASTPGGTRAGGVIKQYADAFKGRVLLNIDGARRMRSELLDRLRTDGGLSKQDATRVTGQVMDAVNRDIENALNAAGKKSAARAYKFADRFYAQTRAEIEQNIQKFVGTDKAPKSVEQTLAAMNAAAGPKGNARALTGMLARMTPEDRADYAATLAENLGRKSADEPFSPGTFLSNIRGLSPQARRIIFGAEGERSIQNLIRLSTAKQESVQRLNNSRSGQVTNYRAVLSNLLVGLPGGGALLGAGAAFNGASGAAGGAAIGGGILGASRALAKALMNEDFTRAVAQAPATTSPKAIDAHFGRLRQIATKDPNVRAVVEALEQKLLSHANDNAMRSAAASDPNSEQNQ